MYIKEQEGLGIMTGNARVQKIVAVKSRSSKNPKNPRELVVDKQLDSELDNLSTYNHVDPSEEWLLFSQKL